MERLAERRLLLLTAEMTNAERVARCHILAKEAKQLAEGASEGLRNAYLELAQHLLKLADQIAQESVR